MTESTEKQKQKFRSKLIEIWNDTGIEEKYFNYLIANSGLNIEEVNKILESIITEFGLSSVRAV